MIDTKIGDWEVDTITGAKHCGAIVSAVDRASKLTKLVKVDKKTAEEVGQALTKKLKPIEGAVLTLTADNGKEFAGHQMLGAELRAAFYFAKPYHAWERGLNEHTNGLVRQYYSKKTSFTSITAEEVECVEVLLNNRPRKVLNFETPLEAFNRLARGLTKVK